MANSIEEIITTLYEMVQDAWSLPLGAEKCVLERDKELKQVTNEYVDDALRRTEDSIANALNEIKASRSSFMALTGAQPKQPSPIIEDI